MTRDNDNVVSVNTINSHSNYKNDFTAEILCTGVFEKSKKKIENPWSTRTSFKALITNKTQNKKKKDLNQRWIKWSKTKPYKNKWFCFSCLSGARCSHFFFVRSLFFSFLQISVLHCCKIGARARTRATKYARIQWTYHIVNCATFTHMWLNSV